MEAIPKFFTVKELCEGFVYSESEQKGLFGLAGKLTIQPEYQRNYIYCENDSRAEAAVIDSVLKNILWAFSISIRKRMVRSKCWMGNSESQVLAAF